MKSQLDLIEADFKLLHSEFKKKNPQIGQSVGTALLWIQQNNQNPEKLMCQPVELLEPLKLLFEAKIVKTNIVAMNSLQRITQTFAISDPNLVLMILGMLKDASEILIDEMTEIRILQMILTFLDPSKLQMSKELANLVVLCCCQMFDTKSFAVKSTIQATLKQLFTVILADFNTVVNQQTPEILQKANGLLGHSESQQLIAHYREKVNTRQIYAVLHSMIQKIAFTMMAFENKTTKQSLELMWNFKPSQFSKCVMLDCLLLCLSQSNETFRYFPEIVSIFELQVIPTLEQLLMSKQINSQLGVREMKLAILIINHLSCGFGLLRQILIDADSLTSKSKDGSIKFELNWRGLVAFECLQVAISNPSLSQLLSTSSLSIGAPIIIQILESYSKVARAIELAANPENKQTHYSTKVTPKVITNANLETEIPAPTLSQIERIIIESVATFAENLNQTVTLTKVKPKRSKDQLDDEQRNRQTLSLCWAPILSIIEKLIQLVTDEVCLQLLLKAYVNLIGACGAALFFDGRDAILTSLCRECLTIHKEAVKESKTNPPTTQRGKAAYAVGSLFGSEKCSVTSRNMQVTRSLLEIANKQHSVLDVKSWSIILETMQKVECVITEKLQLNGMQKRGQKDKPTFNVDGLQQLINFEELKSKVNDLRQQESTRTNAEEETKGKPSRIQTFDELSDSLKSHHVITESYLLDSIDHFFINTITFDINSLAGLICALAQLTVGALEHLKYSGQNQFVAGVRSSAIISDKATSGMFMTQTDSEILAQINTFAMSRLVEATLVNVSRIESLWKIIVAHFDILNNCQVLAVRQLTIEALQTIVLEIFAHKKACQRQPVKRTKQMKPDLEQLALAKKMSKEACSPETETPSVDPSRESDEEMEDADDRAEDEEMWADSAWQYTILHPLADQLKSNHNHDKFAVIKGFEKIIQKCGQQIRNEGWRIIIVTISKSLEFESEQTVACGFRCLKLVVNNFIDRLSQENFVTVLNAIHLYAGNKQSGNINSNLIAIGMFQNIADYIAKQILKKDGSQDAGFVDSKEHQSRGQSNQILVPRSFVDQPRDQKQDVNEINFDSIWEILFKRIESLGSDHRTEVRCTTIHTLENIIMIHGASFATSPSDSTLWRKILMDVLQTMLGLAVDKYAGLHSTEQQTTQKQDSKQRAFPKSQKSFEEASVVKALQQNDAQWEETCKILIQVSCRALKKYFIVMQESHNCKLAGQFYEQLTRQIVSVLSVGSMEACKAVFKCLQDFLSHPTCLHLALIKPEQLYQLLDATIAFLSFEINTKPQSKQVATSTQDNKNTALKALKMCPIFIETLQKVFNQQTLQTSQIIEDEESNSLNEQSEERKRPDPAVFSTISQKRLATLVFRLLSQMLAASSNTSDGMSAFGSQQKLLTEEKIVFDFIETLNDFYLGEPDIQQCYIDFLLSFTEYTGNPRFEAVIRRVLQILYNKLLTRRVNPTLITHVVLKVFDRMQALVDLRYNPDLCSQLIQQAKGQQTLFTTVGLFAILLGSFLINPEQFKSRLGSYVQRIEESKSAYGLSVNSENDDLLASNAITDMSKVRALLQPSMPASAIEDAILKGIFVTGNQTYNDGLLFSESTELITIRPETISTELNQDTEIKQLVWEKIIKLMKSSLLFDLERTREHSKATMQELIKISHDLDMQVVSFIVTCLLPNSSDVQNLPGQDSQRSFEHSLVSIIDQSCISSAAASSNTSTMSQLSRYCFNNMFDLCRYREDASSEGLSADQQSKIRRQIEVRQKVARIATPILINRCRQTLRKFVTDEIKVGSLSMPRNRINEAVFILENLRSLNCYPQSFSKTDIMPVNPLERAVVTQSLQPLQCSTPNKKGHLIELMPVFADLVMSNEIGLKENLREIFIEISKALLNEKQKQEETRNNDADTK